MPKDRYYRPELDALRFLAFFFVFITHSRISDPGPRMAELLGRFMPLYDASVLAAGFGLTLFFVLSAFLICELLLREREATGTVNIKQFYIRRILRIWPLYYLGLAIGVVVAFLPGGHVSDIVGIGWFGIFLSTWIIPARGFIGNPASPLWSISVEEQFYAVVPCLAKYLTRKMLYAFSFAVVLVSNVVLIRLGQAPLNRIWGNSFVQFEAFAAGLLTCLILHGRLPSFGNRQRLVLLATGWLCWLLAAYRFHVFFEKGQNPGSRSSICGYALASLGAVLFLISFLGLDTGYFPRWAIYLGRISYGLYAYHEFALYVSAALQRHLIFAIESHTLKALRAIALEVVLPLVLTVVAAALSYRFFETPFLKMKKRHTFIESQPIAGYEGAIGELASPTPAK